MRTGSRYCWACCCWWPCSPTIRCANDCWDSVKPPILEARELSVGYGAVRALEQVSIDLHAGSVTCVMGENGAGKSTLIRVLSGVIRPSTGLLLLDGGAVRFRDPRAARKAGIVTVY